MPVETDTTTDQNSTDLEYHLGSYGVPRLGVDNEGRRHYLDHANDRIIVADADGDVIDVRDLNGRSPIDWVAFIADPDTGDVVGWRVHGAAQMLDALAGAFEDEEGA